MVSHPNRGDKKRRGPTDIFMSLMSDLYQEMWAPLWFRSPTGWFCRWASGSGREARAICTLYADVDPKTQQATNVKLQLHTGAADLPMGEQSIVWLAGKNSVPLTDQEPEWAIGQVGTEQTHEGAS